MAIIGARKNWKVSTPRSRATRGPLIRVQLGEGHMVKMYRQDAIDQGLLPGEKMVAGAEDKMVHADAGNKAAETPPDDFTAIEGVGKATARSLAGQGITTYAHLREADLTALNLSKGAVAAITAWREEAE